MRKGFTIIELLVAMAILVVLLAASGVIFSMAVEAQQAAKATGEITEKLRAITGQLTNDFGGLEKNSAVAIWFEYDPTADTRYDQVMFFVTSGSNMSSTRLYDNDPDPLVDDYVPVSGSTARIYYGHADKVDYTARTDADKAVVADYKAFNTLARRQHIVTIAYNVQAFPDTADFTGTFIPFDEADPSGNDYFEYDTLTLDQWDLLVEVDNDPGLDVDPVNAEHMIMTCFDNDASDGNSGRVGIDLKSPDTLHMLFSQGVGDFSIQWAYIDPVSGLLRWFPSVDPDGDGNTADSNFVADPSFGILINDFSEPVGAAVNIDVDTDGDGSNDWQTQKLLPDAFKFTFTLYDSKRVFKDGKTFTHIVYLQ